MNINEIITLLDARVVTKFHYADKEFEFGFASDLMSDVLTINKRKILLITGLNNVQTLRTAEMSEIWAVVITRNKKASEEMISLANENHICILESKYSLFKSSGILFQAGLKPVY